jgi:hypothetical protein
MLENQLMALDWLKTGNLWKSASSEILDGMKPNLVQQLLMETKFVYDRCIPKNRYNKLSLVLLTMITFALLSKSHVQVLQ